MKNIINILSQFPIFIIGLILFHATAYGQDFSMEANEASLREAPINGFSGAASYNVSIGSVSSGKLSFPVSISYYSDGFKPNVACSPVGAGWTLNDNYLISKQNIGKNDLLQSFCYPENNNCGLDDLYTGYTDAARDIYTYVINGEKGNFVIDPLSNEVIYLQKTNHKIERIISMGLIEFCITSSDGTKIFLKSLSYNNGVEDVYKPYKIKSYDEKDSITLVHEAQPLGYETLHLNTSNVTKAPAIPTYDDSKQNFGYTSFVSVYGKNDTLNFSYKTRLDIETHGDFPEAGRNNHLYSVQYRTGGNCLETLLESDYFRDYGDNPSQIRLNKIQKRKCYSTTDTSNAYYFEYYGGNNVYDNQFAPAKSTAGIDKWKYYNGASNSKSNMLPSTIYPGGADREPNLTHCSNTLLKNIIEPNGSIIQLYYEQNQYVKSPDSTIYIAYMTACDSLSGLCTGTYTDLENVSINAANLAEGAFHLSFYPSNTIPEEGAICEFRILTLSNVPLYYLSFNTFEIDPIMVTKNLNELKDGSGNPVLQAGETYKFDLYAYGGKAILESNYLYTHPSTQIGPGVRVSKIIKRSEDNHYNETHFFKYKDGNLYDNPKFKSTYAGNQVYFLENVFDKSALFSSSVGYGEVLDSIPGLGKTKIFYHSKIIPSHYFFNDLFVPSMSDGNLQGTGNVSKKIVYDSIGTIISLDSFQYILSHIDSFILSQEVVWNDGSTYFNLLKSYRGGLNRPLKTESYYLGTKINTTEYTYGHTHTTLPSLVKSTSGNGFISEMWTDFTNNTWVNSDVKNYFIDKNVHLPYTSQVYNNGLSVSGYTQHHAFYDQSGSFHGGSNNAPNLIARNSQLFKLQYHLSGDLTNGSDPAEYYNHTYSSDGYVYQDQQLNYPITAKSYDRKRLTSADNNGFVTRNTYYGTSNLAHKIFNVDSTYVEYEYDALLRVKKKTFYPSMVYTEFNYEPYTVSIPYTIVKEKTTFGTVSGSGLNIVENYNYSDKYGRQVAVVKKGASPAGKDVIYYTEYDKFGRKARAYLPYETADSDGSLEAVPSGTKHTRYIYENSLLSRLIEVVDPDSFSTKYEYGLNLSTDNIPGFSSANTLYKETIIDGNGNRSIIFKDFRGRIILSRQTNASDESIARKDTRTIYDNKDRVVKVIPPDATESTTPELVYEYEYDDENKLTRKKIPGRDWTYYWYNEKDLLAAVQDANLSSQSKYICYLYDDNGRQIKSGLASSISNLENPSFTSVLTEDIYGSSTFEKDKIVTTKSKIAGTSDFITNALTYDNRGRVEESTFNTHTYNTANKSVNYTYDNGDNLLTTSWDLPNMPDGTYTYTEVSTYDHRGRLLTDGFTHGANSKKVGAYTYNYRDELVRVSQGFVSGSTYLQDIDYSYKNNGLLKAINEALTVGATSGDLFYEELYYETPIASTGSSNQKKWQYCQW